MKSLELARCSFVRKVTIILASGFGLGLSPIAPGTAGTLLGLVVVFALPSSIMYQICLAALLVVLAIPICTIAEEHFGKKDDGRIVADEYMTFPICLLGLAWQSHLYLLAVAFLTHRIFDIIKPFPAFQIQKLGGGKGIVLDDMFSSIYALAANHAIYRAVVFFSN
ncbi:MAG: phosphatidylglycerophosphatase A [bacterium]